MPRVVASVRPSSGEGERSAHGPVVVVVIARPSSPMPSPATLASSSSPKPYELALAVGSVWIGEGARWVPDQTPAAAWLRGFAIVTAAVSFGHWIDYRSGGWRQRLDWACSSVLFCWILYALAAVDGADTRGGLVAGAASVACFGLSCRVRCRTRPSRRLWHLGIHAAFRYFGYWMFMAVARRPWSIQHLLLYAGLHYGIALGSHEPSVRLLRRARAHTSFRVQRMLT